MDNKCLVFGVYKREDFDLVKWGKWGGYNWAGYNWPDK